MIILDIILDLTMLVDSCDDPTPAFGNSNPSPPSNGRYSVRSNVSFSCHSGFQIAGNSFSICQMNYTWSPEPPNCYSSNGKLKNLLVESFKVLKTENDKCQHKWKQ